MTGGPLGGPLLDSEDARDCLEYLLDAAKHLTQARISLKACAYRLAAVMPDLNDEINAKDEVAASAAKPTPTPKQARDAFLKQVQEIEVDGETLKEIAHTFGAANVSGIKPEYYGQAIEMIKNRSI